MPQLPNKEYPLAEMSGWWVAPVTQEQGRRRDLWLYMAGVAVARVLEMNGRVLTFMRLDGEPQHLTDRDGYDFATPDAAMAAVNEAVGYRPLN